MDTPPSGSGPVVEEIWPCGRRSLRIARKQSLSSILLASERRCTYGCGCGYGRAPMAKRTALCLPSTNSDHTNSKKGKRVRPLSHTDFPELVAGEIVAGGANEALGRPVLASPAAQRSPLTSSRGDFTPTRTKLLFGSGPWEVQLKCYWVASEGDWNNSEHEGCLDVRCLR